MGLQKTFHNPFYAGWVVSEKLGVAYGQVRGEWEPLVTPQEYERGLEVLRKNDKQKSRHRRHFYLLRHLLWLRENGKEYKMFVTTPTGRSQSYSYYLTHAKIDGKKVHIPCEKVDSCIPDWLAGIAVDPEALPTVREHYRSQLNEVTRGQRNEQLEGAKKRVTQLREEEVQLGRLLITGKLSEESYDQLRLEWAERILNAERTLADATRENETRLDELDTALSLMTVMSRLYEVMTEKQRHELLRILVKRLILDREGTILDYELNAPFAYLHGIVIRDLRSLLYTRGSVDPQEGPPASVKAVKGALKN